MTKDEAIKSALDKVKSQKEFFGFMDRFNVDENWAVMQALKKQIPIKVLTMKYRNDYDWTCNNCDITFKYVRYTADEPNYCPNCGQALKWE